jgi:hypothetical protein
MVQKRGNGRKRASKKNKANRPKDFALVADSKIRSFTPMCYGFPDKLKTTLRYHANGLLQSVSGSVAQYVFRWNSIFDPDYTSAGHQPLYHDTYGAIYDHYAVVSARARIRFLGRGSANTFVSVNLDDDVTASVTGDTLAEQSHGVHDILGFATGGAANLDFNVSWDCEKVLGINPYASESYKTAFGTNPSEISTLVLTAIALGGGSTDTDFDIELEFDCLFTELATPVQS